MNQIFGHPEVQVALERRCRLLGQDMYWPAVGAHYLNLFQKVVRESAPPTKLVHAQLQLTLTSAIERNVRHAIERS